MQLCIHFLQLISLIDFYLCTGCFRTVIRRKEVKLVIDYRNMYFLGQRNILCCCYDDTCRVNLTLVQRLFDYQRLVWCHIGKLSKNRLPVKKIQRLCWPVIIYGGRVSMPWRHHGWYIDTNTRIYVENFVPIPDSNIMWYRTIMKLGSITESSFVIAQRSHKTGTFLLT